MSEEKTQNRKQAQPSEEVECCELLCRDDLKDCPFCGEKPDIETKGSCIDIECCVSMGRQKCDYLTIEQRQTTGEDGYSYSDEVESYVLDQVVREWNTRIKYNTQDQPRRVD